MTYGNSYFFNYFKLKHDISIPISFVLLFYMQNFFISVFLKIYQLIYLHKHISGNTREKLYAYLKFLLQIRKSVSFSTQLICKTLHQSMNILKLQNRTNITVPTAARNHSILSPCMHKTAE